MKNLKKEVDIAAEQAPVTISAGEYQLSFLDHLFKTIEDLKKHIDNASTWIHLFNSRRQKQSYYWAMTASKGTKFLLSQERQVATSIG